MAVKDRFTEVAAGDLVEVSGRRVGDPARTGEVVDVLGAGEHVHYLVRWEDGHTTLLYSREGTTFRKASGRGRRRAARKPASPAEEVARFLKVAAIEFEVLPHRRTTTAIGEARALGVLPQVVAKTLVATDDDGGCIRAVVPATSRLGLAKLADAVQAAHVRLLGEPELVSAYPQFELGAVPPFAGPAGDRTVVDRSLAEAEYVIVEAGVHDASLRLRGEDLVAITDAEVADIAV